MTISIENEVESGLVAELRELRKEVLELKQLVQGNPYITKQSTAPVKEGLDGKIAVLLHEIGITANLKGFNLLREAIKLVIQDESLLGAFSTNLYPSLANKYSTTIGSVERAIRHAIEVSFSQKYFHPFYQTYFLEQKPTNASFIALIADKFKLEEAN